MNTHAPLLAATDFSGPAQQAIDRAARLARERSSPLHLLHVLDPAIWSTPRRLLPGARTEHDCRKQAAQSLRDLADRLNNEHGVAVTEGNIMEGRAAVLIAEQARAIGAGLIVIGAHGGGILRGLALGGTATKLLRQSPCPVLVVRRAATAGYRQVLLATDFSATSRRALTVALAAFPEATLTALHAFIIPYEGRMWLAGATSADIDRYREEEAAALRLQLNDFLKDSRVPVTAIVRHGHAVDIALEEIELRAADLLVLGKHGASTFDEILLGSVTLNLLHEAPCDLLLVP
ncbi:MAG: universal stress protein [Gammaproteobacteria bacterium]|nr:universal stress protein [Gammaproteobacteria bacterium]